MCNILVYSAKHYDEVAFCRAGGRYGVKLTDVRLTVNTAYRAKGFEAVCVFANDDLGWGTLHQLKANGVKYILLRCAGYDRLDLDTARELGFRVARVPAYSPESIAEYTLTLTLALVRRLPQTQLKQGAGNYDLDGLVGFTLHGKQVGIIGGGKIGAITARLFEAFGCKVKVYDPYLYPNVSLLDVVCNSDIVSLHCPLTEGTRNLINAATIPSMKPGALLINTARGGLVNTTDLLEDLDKNHRLGGYAADVVEGEAGVFFEREPYIPPQIRHLRSHPNVILTGHQAFLTTEALRQIAKTTFENITRLIAEEDFNGRIL